MSATWVLLLAAEADPRMTGGAWLFLGLAWAFVIVLAVWCFARVLGGGRRES